MLNGPYHLIVVYVKVDVNANWECGIRPSVQKRKKWDQTHIRLRIHLGEQVSLTGYPANPEKGRRLDSKAKP